MNIVELENLSFSYDSDRVTLNNVTFAIKEGESASIIGPNGGGKSTLLKILLGLLTPQNGSVKILGKSPADSTRLMGYMPQYHQLDAAFPIAVSEVVLQGRLTPFSWGRYKQDDRKIAQEALEIMGIGDLAKRSFAELSGGQRQRVLIARALACQPKILLLDEPTANIDPGAEEQFYNTLKMLRKQMSVFTVSHDLGFVEQEVDHVICINREVMIHPAKSFTQKTADDLYKHEMNFVLHNHACSCGYGKNGDKKC